ncbi:hypothetical protein G9444_6296 [Rhodococcus erythropolis]|uniref:Resolvase/invertase-type recombinase catalytic domain-containing protein n=1 Tax=Rhodococcus erythropolis TaxID=1833 RepID=A0A6G9D2X5_RHOER|nr:hypothetical protein G9444_6296 [Rhodococcus erythropolis]
MQHPAPDTSSDTPASALDTRPSTDNTTHSTLSVWTASSTTSCPAPDRIAQVSQLLSITSAKVTLSSCLLSIGWGRSLVDTINTLDALRKRGIYVRALREGIDTSTPAGRMVAGVFASLAELERELIHERAAVAREAARARGKQSRVRRSTRRDSTT